MALAIREVPVPLETRQGVVVVAGTRVTLDTVIDAFRTGATPEEIALRYPSVGLGDIYAVVSYYLRHGGEVDAYLRSREQQHEQIRRQNEARFDQRGVRERLLARRTR